MRSQSLLGITVLCLSSLAATGTAGTISAGFEAPYIVGNNINGQQGWSDTGLYDAQVTSDAAYEGTQSLRMSNIKASGSFGDQTFTPLLAVSSGESSVSGQSDTFLSSWYFKTVVDTLQDGLGVSVSADNGSGARMTWVRMQDDAKNGLNLQFTDTTATGGFPPSIVLATNLDRTQWHRVDMNIHFVDGPHNDVVQVFLDGTLLYTGTTWEDFERFGDPKDGGSGGITSVDSLLFRVGTAAALTPGQGFYIDNVTLTSDIPEPGTMGLMLAGILFLVTRRTPRS